MNSRTDQRRELRTIRTAIVGAARSEATARACARVTGSAIFESAASVALYRGTDGEIDPDALGAAARAAGKSTWYPVVSGDEMRFRRWEEGIAWRTGAFGIDEPADGETIEGTALDLVVVPLVGFDERGHRLGMGKGFYDRAFEACADPAVDSPVLVGLAFDEQEVPAIDALDHDVQLDLVVTPTRWIAPRR